MSVTIGRRMRRPAPHQRQAVEAFDAVRRDFLAAWRDLVRAGLGQDTAAQEAAATASAMRQIAALEGRE